MPLKIKTSLQMHLYKTAKYILLENAGTFSKIERDWDELVNRDDLHGYLSDLRGEPVSSEIFNQLIAESLLVPAGSQEVWAAGVTYLRSRDARMEESREAMDFYQKVYEAERPELFFKSLVHRVAAHRGLVYIRRDSFWNVPEPELTLFINSNANVQGYTIGNDMSSRDIEGENPLYLPQAKSYERSAALGPCLYVPERPLASDTQITMTILRDGLPAFNGSISIDRMKRTFSELVGWLYREFEFPAGCYLMTGTGIVPPAGFTLLEHDWINISIDPIGTLSNKVGKRMG
jgi:2-dehydro-3-deoxy-D-arabinonate dehydratase